MNENKMLGLAWISPYIIGLIVFTAFPFVSSFFLSFTEYDLMSPPVFNGIENYRYMLTEDGVWHFGSALGIFLGAVHHVPQLKFVRAMIDGASKWQMFMKVTVPLITPVIFFNFIMQTTQAFQEFTGPYVITGGGPTYSTYLFSLYIYDTAFKYFDMGYGAALAWVLFLVVAVFAAIAFKSSKYWVFYSADKGGKNG